MLEDEQKVAFQFICFEEKGLSDSSRRLIMSSLTLKFHPNSTFTKKNFRSNLYIFTMFLNFMLRYQRLKLNNLDVRYVLIYLKD